METVFDRLYSASTVASRNRKAHNKCEIQTAGRGDQSKETQGGKCRKAHQIHDQPKKSDPVAHHAPKLLSSIINIIKSSSERPQDFQPWSCYCSSTVSFIHAFKEGKLSRYQLASKIIDDLFESDFQHSSRSKWDIDGATIVQDKDDDSTFSVMKEATYNRKDIYAVATTKAVIQFLADEIRIVGHYYYVAG